MDVSISIGRSVMKDESRLILRLFENLPVYANLFPVALDLRLPLWKVGPHREVRAGQVQGRLVVHVVV